MWTTPAPPSTAFVAASIWSGTGDVKISPGHAASSMPRPTKPPCSGSWPEPPPETSPTLPATGASFRTTIWLSTSTRSRSACAAARPASDSLTTSVGSLMNFLTATVATLTARSFLVGGRGRDLGAVGLGDGFLDRPHDAARRRDEVVRVRGDRRSDQLRGYIRA